MKVSHKLLQLLLCSMSSFEYLFGLIENHMYLLIPIGGENISGGCCAMGGPIGTCVGPIIDLPGAVGIS